MKKEIKTAEILCVGTELLLGDIVNTNATFLSCELAKLGICVYHHTVVGDNPERLAKALRLSLSRSDLVITSGGLGPTKDDLTKETIAELLGRSMYMDVESLHAIEAYFASTGRIMSENNKKQAMMPEGAIILPNRYGTAPALALEDGDEAEHTVIMLPGPPVELVPLFFEEVLPYLCARAHSAIVSKNVHFFGIGESALAAKLDTLITEAKNPTVAPYCKSGEVRLRVTASAPDTDTATQMCDECVGKILDSEVGVYSYGIDVDTIERAVVDELHSAGLTLCTAESCTGGLIAKRITDIGGCSDVFRGGVVAYQNEIKINVLGVDAQAIDKYTAVSEEVARQMARGAREKFGADIAVSATGYASAAAGQDIPVGKVFVGISTKDGEEVRELSLSSRRSREFIRIVSATNAFDMILKYIKAKKAKNSVIF